MSTGGDTDEDTDRRPPTGAMLSSDLLVTLNQPASRLIENLPDASLYHQIGPLRKWTELLVRALPTQDQGSAMPRLLRSSVGAFQFPIPSSRLGSLRTLMGQALAIPG